MSKPNKKPLLAILAIWLGFIIILFGAANLTLFLTSKTATATVTSVDGDDFRKDVHDQNFTVGFKFVDSNGNEQTGSYIYSGLSNFGYVPLVDDEVSIRYSTLSFYDKIIPVDEDNRFTVSVIAISAGLVISVLSVAAIHRKKKSKK